MKKTFTDYCEDAIVQSIKRNEIDVFKTDNIVLKSEYVQNIQSDIAHYMTMKNLAEQSETLRCKLDAVAREIINFKESYIPEEKDDVESVLYKDGTSADAFEMYSPEELSEDFDMADTGKKVDISADYYDVDNIEDIDEEFFEIGEIKASKSQES